MKRSFEEAIRHRRSFYAIGDEQLVPAEEIIRAVRIAVRDVPSAFNSQSTRIVLLFGNGHKRLWSIVKDVLRTQVPPEVFPKTAEKIDKSFAGGYGTALFYEDTSVVRSLQERFPLYSDNFPVWSQQTSAMHQFAVWTMLVDLGLGVSLQHYNPLIDDMVRKELDLPENWQLIAQMPFGSPLDTPVPKECQDLDSRIMVVRD